MNKVLHNIWISLIITSLLCLACDKEDPIKTEDSPVVNNDTLKVEVITSDAIGIQPKSATLAALCSVSGADNLQGVACFYYDTIAGSVENLKLNGRKIDSDSITANSNSFYATIKDLKPETQYHFAASITIGGKEYYGSVKTFTTMPIDTRPLILYQHDGTVRYVSNSAVDSITDNGAIKSFYINGSLVAAYSINMLDSIAYQYPSGVTIQPFPNVSDFITAIDNAVHEKKRDEHGIYACSDYFFFADRSGCICLLLSGGEAFTEMYPQDYCQAFISAFKSNKRIHNIHNLKKTFMKFLYYLYWEMTGDRMWILNTLYNSFSAVNAKSYLCCKKMRMRYHEAG